MIWIMIYLSDVCKGVLRCLLWECPSTYPSMTKTTRFGTRVPQRIYPTEQYILWGYPISLPEYDQNNQVWYPGTPEYIPY